MAEKSQRFAELAEIGWFAIHATSDALDGAKQIGKDGDFAGSAVGAQRIFEQDGRPALGQQPGLDLGHFEHGRDRLGDAYEFAGRVERTDEVAK